MHTKRRYRWRITYSSPGGRIVRDEARARNVRQLERRAARVGAVLLVAERVS